MRKKRRWDEEFCKMCEKRGDSGENWGVLLSLPTRERGLKSKTTIFDKTALPSLPTRERGLKSVFSVFLQRL